MTPTDSQTGAIAKVVNVAAYKFAPLTNLPERRERLRSLCLNLELKGTILLSPEGINLFVAGQREAVDVLLTELSTDPEIGELDVKESYNDYPPFSRMLVKLKREIIAFGQDGIDPLNRPAPKIEPQLLKQWLDEGRPCKLLDVRNDYEVRLGSFDAAVPIGIDHFRDFPTAVDALPATMKRERVVMFCTGGIRCEKAMPWMRDAGFPNVRQLDGGILGYFEEVGGLGYEGNCFVFDARVAVDPALRPAFECVVGSGRVAA